MEPERFRQSPRHIIDQGVDRHCRDPVRRGRFYALASIFPEASGAGANLFDPRRREMTHVRPGEMGVCPLVPGEVANTIVDQSDDCFFRHRGAQRGNGSPYRPGQLRPEIATK